MRGATGSDLIRKLATIFQPTRPLRGATKDAETAEIAAYFNPRAPCGARLGVSKDTIRRLLISTHAPLAGRDGNFILPY